MNLGTLLVTIAGNAGPYKKTLTEVQAETATAGKRIGAAGKIAAAGILAIGFAAIKASSNVEEANKIIRAGTGKTGEALKALKADFHAVYGEVPASAEEAASAITDLNSRLSLTGKPLQDLSTKFLELDQIIDDDLGGSIAASTRLFGDWGVAAEDHGKTMDYMFRASQETGAGYTYLAEQTVNYGATLRNLGFDMKSSIALMGKWERDGVNMTTVMSGMKQAVKYYGIAGIDAAEGLKGLIETIKTSDDATGKMAAKSVVGAIAFNDFFDAVKGGKFDLEEMVTALENGTDTIHAAAVDSETSAQKMEKAWRELEEELAPIGDEIVEGLVPAIEDSIPAILELVRALGALITMAAQIPAAIEDAAEALAHGFGGESKNDQKIKLAILDDDHQEWVNQQREKHELTGEWISRMQEKGIVQDDILHKMEFLLSNTKLLSKTEKDYVKTLAASMTEEEAKALRFHNLREAIIKLRKTQKEKNKVDEKANENDKDTVTTTTAVTSSIADLNKEKDELLAKIQADIKATGNAGMVYMNHRADLEALAVKTKAWGQQLDPVSIAAAELFERVDAGAVAMKALHEEMAKTSTTMEDTSENWKQYGMNITGAMEEVDFSSLDDEVDHAADLAGHLADEYENSLTKDFVNSLDFASDYFSTIFGDSGSELAKSTQIFLSYFDESLGDMEAMWSKHWKELTTVGLSSLGNMLPGEAGAGFSGASGGFSLGTSLGSLIPGGAVAGGIIGGVAGFFGGFFGGGESDEEKKQREAEEARKEQERLNALYAQFAKMVEDSLEDQGEYTDEMAKMYVELQAAGYSFEDISEDIADSIAEWEDKIRNAEQALAEWPDDLFAMQDSLESMRFGLIDINERIRDIKASLRDVAGAPIKLQVVEEDLKSAMAELKAAEKAYGDSKSKEDKKRYEEARDKVRDLERERDRLKNMGEIKMKNVEGNTFTGKKAKDAMLRQIRKAQKASREAGRNGKIRASQYKEMMKNAETPEAKALLKQLILAENAKVDRKLQIKRQREQLQAAQKATNTLRHNLPLMRDRLADLNKFRADFGSKGFTTIHQDLTSLEKQLMKVVGLASGGAITQDQLAMLHAGEVVVNKAQVGAFSRAFNTPSYSPQAAANSSAPAPVYAANSAQGNQKMIVEGNQVISINLDGRTVARAIQPYTNQMVKAGHSRTKRETLHGRGGVK